MLRITIPTNIKTKESYNKKGDIITIDIYSDDEESLFTTTCGGWNKKWHKCQYATYEKKRRIVNNNCITCYKIGTPLCITCLFTEDKNITVLSIDTQIKFIDTYINKKNQILCHFLIRCPEFL